MNLGLQKIRVLLAEEDMIQRLLVREYLEMDSRFEVHEAKGVHHIQALCKSKVAGIALVLLDMEFSRVDSIGLVLEIRKVRPDLRIIGMTERQADLYAEPRLRKSGTGFIPKPFSPFLLHRSIQALFKPTRANIGRIPKAIPVRKIVSSRRGALYLDRE